MWDVDVCVGSLAIWALWATAFVLVVVGWSIGHSGPAHLGIAVSAGAASLTVMRDNQRTRRMLARKGESVAPLRGRGH